MRNDLATVLNAGDRRLTQLGVAPARASRPAHRTDGGWDNRPTCDNWFNRR